MEDPETFLPLMRRKLKSAVDHPEDRDLILHNFGIAAVRYMSNELVFMEIMDAIQGIHMLNLMEGGFLGKCKVETDETSHYGEVAVCETIRG